MFEPQRDLSPDQVAELVTYHRPTDDQVERITNLRECAEIFINALQKNCPRSADRSSAVRSVREALLWGNASIMLDGVLERLQERAAPQDPNPGGD